MSHTPETTNGAGETIKVGSTGTIGSLMSLELESVKDSGKAPASSPKKLQTAPVSVPCGYSPKRSQLRRNPPLEPGSSSSGGSGNSSISGSRSPLDVQKPKPRRNGHRSPMLTSSAGTVAEKSTSTGTDSVEKKGGHTCIVEVVDLKCNNPMSSRLKKLGFSKLSESIA